jgi:large subunit ribosomal protein L15
MVENGLASKNELIKILGTGDLINKIDVTAHSFSASAKAAIEEKGGTTSIV